MRKMSRERNEIMPADITTPAILHPLSPNTSVTALPGTKRLPQENPDEFPMLSGIPDF